MKKKQRVWKRAKNYKFGLKTAKLATLVVYQQPLGKSVGCLCLYDAIMAGPIVFSQIAEAVLR